MVVALFVQENINWSQEVILKIKCFKKLAKKYQNSKHLRIYSIVQFFAKARGQEQIL